ncbi:hypothetical protein [Mesorhizobium sp. M0618]|uniref:hypothetical protein n=1 Tax=unclassified Mesorhizobium TaxID=325217 RepID=UPI003335D792
MRQFNKLPADKQVEVHRAYLALISPSNLDQPDPEPVDTRAIPRGHLSNGQKLAIGRWVERQEDLSRSMAHQCMRLPTAGTRRSGRMAARKARAGAKLHGHFRPSHFSTGLLALLLNRTCCWVNPGPDRVPD